MCDAACAAKWAWGDIQNEADAPREWVAPTPEWPSSANAELAPPPVNIVNAELARSRARMRCGNGSERRVERPNESEGNGTTRGTMLPYDSERDAESIPSDKTACTGKGGLEPAGLCWSAPARI